MPAHMIEHSLSALYDIAHGAGLSIVLPAWMTYTAEAKTVKMARFAREVFGVDDRDNSKAAQKGIANLKAWFASIGSPVSLKEANIPEENIDAIAQNAEATAKLWFYESYTKDIIAGILRNAC